LETNREARKRASSSSSSSSSSNSNLINAGVDEDEDADVVFNDAEIDATNSQPENDDNDFM